jgi:hypothetical protein
MFIANFANCCQQIGGTWDELQMNFRLTCVSSLSPYCSKRCADIVRGAQALRILLTKAWVEHSQGQLQHNNVPEVSILAVLRRPHVDMVPLCSLPVHYSGHCILLTLFLGILQQHTYIESTEIHHTCEILNVKRCQLALLSGRDA